MEVPKLDEEVIKLLKTSAWQMARKLSEKNRSQLVGREKTIVGWEQLRLWLANVCILSNSETGASLIQ